MNKQSFYFIDLKYNKIISKKKEMKEKKTKKMKNRQIFFTFNY